MIDIKLPELGEGISTVEISIIRVKIGDSITINEPIIIVETEKVSMEIPATSSGTITKIHVKKGDTIGPGDIIISISGDDLESYESVTTIGNNTSEIKNGDKYTSLKNLSNTIPYLFFGGIVFLNPPTIANLYLEPMVLKTFTKSSIEWG